MNKIACYIFIQDCETLKQVISRKGTRQNDARPQHFVNFGTDMNSDDKAPLRWTVPPQSNVDSRQFLYVPGEKVGHMHNIPKLKLGLQSRLDNDRDRFYKTFEILKKC